MKNAFEELEEVLGSVESWLEAFARQPLSRQKRELAESLARYVKHCRRDKRKWRSESAAQHAIIKINRVWYTLYIDEDWRP
jgi:hypothetical protein